MPVTCIASAKSCGVTTAALALTMASARPSLLAECDPAGGTIRAGLLQGQVSAGYGLYHLAAADRVGPVELANAFASHLWPLDGQAGHRRALFGLTDPAQAAALSRTWPALSDVLHVMAESADYDVFVDAGRLALEAGRLHPTLTPAPLLYKADLVLLAVRGTEQALTLTRHLIRPLRTELEDNGTGAGALGLLLIEDGPFRSHQVAEALEAPVLAVLPWDPDTAAYLTAGGKVPRGFARSPLLRYARTATEQFEVIAARRQVHQHDPASQAHTQLAGILDRLAHRGGARG
ncbi:MinD/ParA family ATP-binding protein [Streptomyces sp. 2A115]|uniref:MinD/ParA family ATP-binding protein n=1 Tax=Streptomyces sp. 2A115 TaxID=3457439 RepID=UPI003FD0E095